MLHGIDVFTESQALSLGIVPENDLGKQAVTNDKVYQMITDMVVEAMEKNKDRPWVKPWDGARLANGSAALATNYVSKKRYRGANAFLLNFVIPLMREKAFSSPYFMTFKQVQNAGGKIKKGSHGYPVMYYQMVYKFKGKNISEALYWEYFSRCSKGEIKEGDKDQCPTLMAIPIARYYKVFNGEDIEGVDFKLPTKKPKPKTSVEAIDSAQKIIDLYPEPKFKTIEVDADGAFYVPSKDSLNMPPIEVFNSAQEYYSTYFHEAVHSTGHKSRLQREMKGKFGSKPYAQEELIAELGAVFLCAESGILFKTIDNSSVYIKGWMKRLTESMKKDNKFFIKASSEAQKAADFILQPNSDGVPLYLLQKEPKTDKNGQTSLFGAAATKVDVNHNVEKNGLEIVFTNGKPTTEVRSWMKANKYIYSRKNKLWFKTYSETAVKELDQFFSSLQNKKTEPKKNDLGSLSTALITTASALNIADRIAAANKSKPKENNVEPGPTNSDLNFDDDVDFRNPLDAPPEKKNVFVLGGELGKMLKELQRYRLAILLTGDPHAGKSELVHQLMNEFLKLNLTVGFFDLEQGGLDSKDTIGALDRNIPVKNRTNLNITGEAAKGFDTVYNYSDKFDVVVVDSWQKLEVPLTKFDNLRRDFPNTIFIIISQQNAKGGTRGGVSGDYDAPVRLKVHKVNELTHSENFVEVKKNRGNSRDLGFCMGTKKAMPIEELLKRFDKQEDEDE